MTHKIFFRYFISIFALCILTTAIVLGFIYLNYTESKVKWMDEAFNEFSDNLAKRLDDFSYPDDIFSIIQMELRIVNNDRIRGYIVSDIEGKTFFPFGRSKTGKSFGAKAVENPTTATIKNTRTINLEFIQDSVRASITKDLKKKTINLPPEINRNEIIGTIEMDIEGTPYFYISVLTYTPSTYSPMSQIVRPALRSLMISIPVCLLMAALGAWLISSISSKSIASIRNALNELSHEKEGVVLEKYNTVEFSDISMAVKSLDKSLQANRRSKRAWINSISHDLNTPVMAMKMLIDGMNDGIIKADKNNLKEIQKENDNLASKIEKVIYFSSVQAKSKLTYSKFDASDFAKEIANSNENIEVTVNVDNLICERDLMDRAVRELLENALFFRAEGSKIKLSVSQEEDFFSISVENSGELKYKENASDLFEPWTKGDESRGFLGTGLGLPIVGTVSKLHGGTCFISEKDNVVSSGLRWSVQNPF